MKSIILSFGMIAVVAGVVSLGVTLTNQSFPQKVLAVSYPRSRPMVGQVLQATTANAQCTNISIYTVSGSTWTKVTNFLSLRPGQTVRIAVLGAASSGIFDMARFRVNGQPSTWTQTQEVNPYGEYFITYTFPSNTNSLTFDVEAQVHHATDGWK